MGVSIVITSGKGGVGKTTTTANIGTALASLGKRVVVIDGDTGLRNLDVLLGLENRIVYTIIDVIEGRCRLKQGLIKDKRFQNLCLFPRLPLASFCSTQNSAKIVSRFPSLPPGGKVLSIAKRMRGAAHF